VELLNKYEDLFQRSFSKMKRIAEALLEMKIHLNLDVKPVRKIPYRLNLKYKEKVHKELDQMKEVGIIVPMEELD
jgi:hypothetical protein